MELKFSAEILQNEDMDAAYVIVPYDIKEIFGCGRLLVNASFDGVPYRGQVVKMGTPDYIIGVTKAIRKQIRKSFGDAVEVILRKREPDALWKCPKCGREFGKKDQGHYCGSKPLNIEDYIFRAEEYQRADLTLIYRTIRDVVPFAEECIAWSMPSFKKAHISLQFAASKKHIGFYPGTLAVEHFRERLAGYQTDKGTVRLPYGKIDTVLIADISKWVFSCLDPE